MIGTIEALGVFVLAILPGYLALRVYGYGRPTLQQARSALGELGETVAVSGLSWAFLYLWKGRHLLPVVLGEPKRTTPDRLDAFAELTIRSVVIGLALGLLWRVGAYAVQLFLRWMRNRAEPGEAQPGFAWLTYVTAPLSRRLRTRSLPASAWDRLMTQLANDGKPVCCRVTTRSGAVVFGTFGTRGYAELEAGGRSLLLDAEMIPDAENGLRLVDNTQGVFVPGDEISALSIVAMAGESLSSNVGR